MAQNLRAVGKSLLLPITTAALTAGIFVADAITDFEIAFPVFYTAIVLLSVGFCKKNGIVFLSGERKLRIQIDRPDSNRRV